MDKELSVCEGFEWDAGNVQKSWRKHSVTCSECEQVFFNRPLLALEDVKHSATEKRYFALGVTDGGRRLFVAFTLRERRIRVISARDMSRRERSIYEEKSHSEIHE